MLIRNVEYELKCDIPNCYSCISSKSYKSQTSILMDAAKQGWEYVDYLDKFRCPECVKNGCRFSNCVELRML